MLPLAALLLAFVPERVIIEVCPQTPRTRYMSQRMFLFSD